MARLVVFNDNGARIHHVENVKDIKSYLIAQGLEGKPHLIDPVYPPGVPPHLWKNGGDKIVLVTTSKKRSLPIKRILLALAISLTAFFLCKGLL